jgi:hypothetical protein
VTAEAHSRSNWHPERYGLLLGTIIAAFAVQGIAEPAPWEGVVTSALLGASLVLSLWAAHARASVMRLSAVISSAVLLATVVAAAKGSVDIGATRVANALLVALAPPAVILGVVRSLRTRQQVTPQAVLGVLCVYLLLGMFFAFVFGAIDRLGGHPFFAGGQPATVAQCLYFSFTSLTTVGYGDLTARTNLGHTLSVSEALLGQIYLVTVVAVIVANLGRSRTRSG